MGAPGLALGPNPLVGCGQCCQGLVLSYFSEQTTENSKELATHASSYASGCCLRAGGKGAGCIYGQHLILVGAKDYSTTLF